AGTSSRRGQAGWPRGPSAWPPGTPGSSAQAAARASWPARPDRRRCSRCAGLLPSRLVRVPWLRGPLHRHVELAVRLVGDDLGGHVGVLLAEDRDVLLRDAGLLAAGPAGDDLAAERGGGRVAHRGGDGGLDLVLAGLGGVLVAEFLAVLAQQRHLIGGQFRGRAVVR